MTTWRSPLAAAAAAVLACSSLGAQVAASTAIQAHPQVAPAGAGPGLTLAWATTWNHELGEGQFAEDALDVATGLATDADAIQVYGYAEASIGYGLTAQPFLARYAGDGSQLGDGLLNALVGRTDAIAPTGDLRFLSGSNGYGQWLSVLDGTSAYTWPVTIAVGGWVGAGTEVIAMAAHGSNLYVLVDNYLITRWNGTGSIQQWTHEIHLRQYDSTPALVWDKVLAPEVSGILGSDDTGLYVLGGPISDYDVNAPPDDTAPKSITKLAFDGTLIWNRSLGQNTATNRFGYTSLAVESDGLYLAGVTQVINPDQSLGPSDLLVTRLDMAGNVVWSNTHDADAQGLSKWYPRVDVGTSGIYVAADLTTTNAYPYDTDLVVLKVGFDGSQLATARWGQADDEYPQAALVVGDALYVAGYTLSGSPPGGGDAFLVKYLGSTPPDTVAPTASPSLTGTPGANGWYRSTVTVTWNWTDAGAGIDPASCTTESTVSSDGSHLLSAGCSDLAGNVGSASHPVQVDATAPVITCPSAGPFVLGSGDQPVGPAGVDASVSGLDEGASTLSGMVPTDAVGQVSLIFTASDLAGNQAALPCTFNVTYNFTGFLVPVDNPPSLNVARSGTAVPIKFGLDGNQGLAVLAPGYPRSQPVACDTTAPAEPIEETVTAGSSGLAYNADTAVYTYVWRTSRAWSGSCRALTVQLMDGTQHLAYFEFR